MTSSDHAIGELLAKDPRVDVVSFTGSTATGEARERERIGDGEARLPRARWEIRVHRPGRRRPRRRVRDRRVHRCVHAGQGCAITTRLLVPRTHYDDCVDATAATLTKIGCGDPSDPRHDVRPADLGPATRPRRVLPASGRRGGRLVRGGRRASAGSRRGGSASSPRS